MALERNIKKKPARTADRRNVWLLILTTLLIVVSVVLFTPPNEKINQGLDIQGGLSVVLTAKSTDGAPVTPEDMEKSRAIIESRVNALGASEATVQEQGSDQIRADPRPGRHGGGARHHRAHRLAGVRPA